MRTPPGLERIPFHVAVVVLLFAANATVFGQGGGSEQPSPVSQEHQHQGFGSGNADVPLVSQDHQHQVPGSGHADSSPVSQDHQHHGAIGMEVELFPLREASGTSWQPETGPMYGVHRAWRGWGVMLHGHVFGQFIYEPGDRHRTGGTANRQISSVNWTMGMARRTVGAGRVGVRGMVSVEPWTVTDCGYLNLLATGEICDGDTIHDRQHPHDVVMELAADYDRPLRGLPTPRLALQVSAAHLREAEPDLASGPRQDVTRATASAAYHRPVGAQGIWATTLAWGTNSGHEGIPGGALNARTHALLLESSMTVGVRDTWFGRAELVEKPAHDLHAHEYEDRVFTVGKLQLGYLRQLGRWGQRTPGIGGTVSLSVVPSDLAPRYSGRVAPGLGVFVSVLPSRHPR